MSKVKEEEIILHKLNKVHAFLSLALAELVGEPYAKDKEGLYTNKILAIADMVSIAQGDCQTLSDELGKMTFSVIIDGTDPHKARRNYFIRGIPKEEDEEQEL